jgi:hypothetical protein
MRTADPRDTGDPELEDARYEVYLAEREWETVVDLKARRLAAARLAAARERLSLVVASR